jgi:hypothetical protein
MQRERGGRKREREKEGEGTVLLAEGVDHFRDSCDVVILRTYE